MALVPVTVRIRFTTDEHLDSVPLPVRTDAAILAPGTKIEVELGGRWVWEAGERKRIGGHWIACVIVAETKRDLLVRPL